MKKSVIIGGASAFIGDSILGPRQLIDVPGMEYLVFDYLAEMTLSGFSQAKRNDQDLGYAVEFTDYIFPKIASLCKQKGIRLVANAGGLNPKACARKIQEKLEFLGVSLRVAYIEGDECMSLINEIQKNQIPDFYSKAPPPDMVDSANVYLGAPAIAYALSLGADVVITGRIVDSAATLGILMHEFEWKPEDYNLLSAGSLAGHILECGAQASGGLFTDWEKVPDWENIGYPYAVCYPDGTFDVKKPDGTGGLIHPMAVREQVLYEVADPSNYVLPDVICDFSRVNVSWENEDGVRVSGALGKPPPKTYKLTASYQDGYRCTTQVSVFGIDAVKKAKRTATALLNRTREMLLTEGFEDFSKYSSTVFGGENDYGPHARFHGGLREAIARVTVTHASAQALDIFSRETRCAGVSFAPGTTSGTGLTTNQRAVVEPLRRLYTCLVPKKELPAPIVFMNGVGSQVSICTAGEDSPPYITGETSVTAVEKIVSSDDSNEKMVDLIELAHGRSGDKGDTSNIAIFARDPVHYPFLLENLTAEMVADHMSHLVKGVISRFEVPGLHALNFVMDQALDGGGPSSLRVDPMGKGLAQMLLQIKIKAPESI